MLLFSLAPKGFARPRVRVSAAGSPINTWRILMKLRNETPVLHAYFVWWKVEHRSKVKVTKNINKKHFWVITFDVKWKFVNVVPIYLKIGTHNDWTYNMYFTKTYMYINKSDVTYVSMARKYRIIKHLAFSKH